MQIPTALIGCQVLRVAFDYQTRLLLLGQHPDGRRRVGADLVIETPFMLRDAAGQCHELDPSTSRSAVAPLIDLFLATITAVTVIDRGTLTLDFDNGAQLAVSPIRGTSPGSCTAKASQPSSSAQEASPTGRTNHRAQRWISRTG